MSTVQGDPATYAAMTVRQKKAFWRSNPVRGEIPIAIESIPPLVMYSDNDDTVVKELYWTGFRGWERTSLHLWGRIATAASPGLVLDVGCYSGIYSLIAAKANASHRVLAIDIQPRCLARVERNRALNGVANIETVHAACVDTTGSIRYFYYEDLDVLSSIASVEPKPINDRSADAPALTIDGLIEGEDPSMPVTLVKIDVEDAELRTLRGATATLERHRPDVLIEINDPRNVGSIGKLFPRGYNCYSIDELHPRVRRIGYFGKPFDNRNFFFSMRPAGQVAELADWSTSG